MTPIIESANAMNIPMLVENPLKVVIALAKKMNKIIIKTIETIRVVQGSPCNPNMLITTSNAIYLLLIKIFASQVNPKCNNMKATNISATNPNIPIAPKLDASAVIT